MKLKIVIGCILFWSCSQTPENCSLFDGDETACLSKGCRFKESLVWCLKEGACSFEENHPGICYFSDAQEGNNGVVVSAFREGEKLALEFNSPGKLPMEENWKACLTS